MAVAVNSIRKGLREDACFCKDLRVMQTLTQNVVDPMDRLYTLSEFVRVLQESHGIERSYDTLRRWAERKEKHLPVKRLAGVKVCSLRMFQDFINNA
jgi:hypothetical protein